MIEVMTKGHIEVARDRGIDISFKEAVAISEHDLQSSTCIEGEYGSYVVYKTSRSITGDMHFLTKLYVPLKYRGRGYARELLARCEKPLVTCDELRICHH